MKAIQSVFQSADSLESNDDPLCKGGFCLLYFSPSKPSPEMNMDKERQVLEDLILGTDTNDVRTLWEKADSWLSENNFDVAELKEDYPDDPVGCVADCVGSLDHKEVQKQLKKHLSADEIKKRVAAK